MKRGVCISTLKSGLLRLKSGVLSDWTDAFLLRLRLRLGARARGCAAGGSPCRLEGPKGQRGTDGRRSPGAAGRARRWGRAAAATGPQASPPSLHAPPHLGPATSGDSQAPILKRLRKKALGGRGKPGWRRPQQGVQQPSRWGRGAAIPPENEGSVSV